MNGLINGNLNLEPNKSVYQSIRKSGCRSLENQDIRNSENEKVLKPDALIS